MLNAADRLVQVGSHYHSAEANLGFVFDRAAEDEAAYGSGKVIRESWARPAPPVPRSAPDTVITGAVQAL